MYREFTQYFTRPSTNVQWFYETWPVDYPNHAEWFRTKYMDTGLMTVERLFPTELIMTITYVFNTLEAYELWTADTQLDQMAISKTAHNIANNIIET